MHAALENALKLLLAPVLIIQGLRVRKHALILPEPIGPRRGTSDLIADGELPLRLLIVGDSSAAGVGVDHQDYALSGQLVRQLASHYTLDWLLIAQTGATTASTLARLHQTPAQPFDIAVVALGVNDVTRATPLRRWLAQQAMLNNLLGDKFAVRRIYTSGLPPMGQFPVLPNPLRWLIGQTASRFDRAITHARARDPRITQIALDLPLDAHLMAADGFHPGEQVYAIWAEKLSSAIRSDFAQESGGNHAP